MSDAINDGDVSSASKFMEILEKIRSQGQQVLDDLGVARETTLFRFQQDLSALNSRRQMTSRVLSPDIACRFVVSDMLDLDQARSSGTLRIDSQATTCRENSSNAAAVVRSSSFNSVTGTIEQLNNLYRVHVLDDSKPVGVFELEFYDAQTITLLVFDIVSMPSNPDIQVFGSADGLTLIPAKEVSLNGYRVNAWFPSDAIRYVRIQITPRMPDTLGGSTYTFGVTALSAFSVQYFPYSEVYTKPVVFSPVSDRVRFKTNDPSLKYFLQFAGGGVFKVEPDEVISLPGVSAETVDTHINTGWRLSTGDPGSQVPLQLPADVYPSTVSVTDKDANQKFRVAYGLDTTLLNANLENQFLAVQPYQNGGWMDLVPVNNAVYVDQSGRTFSVSYTRGPASMTALLRVQLSTADRSQTPVFRGAWLENVY